MASSNRDFSTTHFKLRGQKLQYNKHVPTGFISEQLELIALLKGVEFVCRSKIPEFEIKYGKLRQTNVLLKIPRLGNNPYYIP